MFAIINYNGNQIKVEEDKEYQIPYFECNENDKIKFDQVMLIGSDKTIVGQPYIKDAYVDGVVLGSGQTPKINVIKFHSKKRYKKIGSHRQDFVKVKITKIIQK